MIQKRIWFQIKNFDWNKDLLIRWSFSWFENLSKSSWILSKTLLALEVFGLKIIGKPAAPGQYRTGFCPKHTQSLIKREPSDSRKGILIQVKIHWFDKVLVEWDDIDKSVKYNDHIVARGLSGLSPLERSIDTFLSCDEDFIRRQKRLTLEVTDILNEYWIQ